jgi:hypothetical protein
MQDFYKVRPGEGGTGGGGEYQGLEEARHRHHLRGETLAIVNYNATVEGRRVSKVKARGMTLSQAQYI